MTTLILWFAGSSVVGYLLLRYNRQIAAFRERESCPPGHADLVAVGTALAWVLSVFELVKSIHQ
jgi:hypothetical protein